jgi:hypothetical protein
MQALLCGAAVLRRVALDAIHRQAGMLLDLSGSRPICVPRSYMGAWVHGIYI